MATSRVEGFVNALLVTTCLLVSGVAIQRLMGHDVPRTPTDYSRGDKLPEVAGVRYDTRNTTILLFLSTHCRFCKASMPFYSRLSERRDADKSQIVVIGTEPEAALSKYLAEEELRVDQVKSIGARGHEFKVSGTPTLVLVGKDGRAVMSGPPFEAHS